MVVRVVIGDATNREYFRAGTYHGRSRTRPAATLLCWWQLWIAVWSLLLAFYATMLTSTTRTIAGLARENCFKKFTVSQLTSCTCLLSVDNACHANQ